LDDSPAVVTNWHATATVDFVNHQGGVDRTNFPMIFIQQPYQDLRCIPDYETIGARDQAAFEAHLKRIADGTEK
jgi:hypothetical protein